MLNETFSVIFKHRAVFFRYDADEYCINKGGHLAEPLTSEESNFLKNYAGKFPNVNWWLGLREAEDCKCRSTDARAAVEFEANIGNVQLTQPQFCVIKQNYSFVH